MSKCWIAVALYVGLACSGSDEEAPAEAGNPGALQAQCRAEVMALCGGFQRAEQFDCVRREVERCMLEAAGER